MNPECDRLRALERWLDDAVREVAISLRSMQEPRCGDEIGRYRLASVIGRGGMATVYLAKRMDGEIERQVAIKFLHLGGHPAWRRRFLAERRLLATLRHPCIVEAIDDGHTAGGHPFLVMEYVEGGPIDRHAAALPVSRRLKLFLEVCGAVAHAHRRSIIHRDLKPSNILIDTRGRPKLLDFGLAKLLGADGDTTQPVERLLTPNYASPEQFTGGAQSPATDIYSLGAVLYKLLTGTAPRENTGETRNRQPAPPSRLNPAVPRDLDFVVAQALRPDPQDRYTSVDAFASDVRAAMECRPVRARARQVGFKRRLRWLTARWRTVRG